MTIDSMTTNKGAAHVQAATRVVESRAHRCGASAELELVAGALA